MKQLLTLFLGLSLIACQKKADGYNLDQKSSSSEGDNKLIYTTTSITAEGEAANLTPEQKMGQELFDGKGNCFSCHKPEEKAIGPGIMEIARIYKEKKGDIPTFLKGNADPIVDPSQFEVMKTNFYITKTFSDEELKAVEAYIYSYTK